MSSPKFPYETTEEQAAGIIERWQKIELALEELSEYMDDIPGLGSQDNRAARNYYLWSFWHNLDCASEFIYKEAGVPSKK